MSTELDQRLRDAHARIDTGPVPTRTQQRVDALILAADTEDAVGPAAGRRRAPRRRAGVAIGAAGLLLAVIALAVVALLPGSDGATGPASARAACAAPGPARPCGSALRSVAQRSRVPGEGQVLYRKTSRSLAGFTVTDRTGERPQGPAAPGPNAITVPGVKQPFFVSVVGTEEQWIAPDGSGRDARSDAGVPILLTPGDRAAWKAAGRPDLQKLLPALSGERPLVADRPPGTTAARLLGANGLYDVLPHTGDPLARVPRDPSRLRDWLAQKAWERRGRRDPGCTASGRGCRPAIRRLIDDTVVGDIETLLAYPTTDPSLRAALVAVLSQRPGARSLGLIRDPSGRQVAAVRLADGAHDSDGANVIAFDPVSGELRGIGTAAGGGVRWNRVLAITDTRVPAIGDRP